MADGVKQMEDFWATFENMTPPAPATAETPVEVPTVPDVQALTDIVASDTTADDTATIIAEATTEPVVEQPEAEAVVEAVIEEAEAPAAEEVSVQVEAPKPKRKRRTKAEMEAARKAEAEKAAAALAEATPVADNSDTATETENTAASTSCTAETNAPGDTITITINKNQTYKDIIKALDLLPAVDEDFIKTKEEIQTKMNQIVVQSGMDRPNVEIMGQKIDELNSIISARMAAMKTAYENLSSREDGILMRVMAKGAVCGSPYNQGNDAARRANGIHAAENFVSPKTKEKVDLYWGVYATRYAKNFYEAAAEQLENKRRLLKQQADFLTMHN